MLRVVLFLSAVAVVEGLILVMRFEFPGYLAAVTVAGTLAMLLIVLMLLAAWSHSE